MAKTTRRALAGMRAARPDRRQAKSAELDQENRDAAERPASIKQKSVNDLSPKELDDLNGQVYVIFIVLGVIILIIFLLVFVVNS